jgi:hypothetical protein
MLAAEHQRDKVLIPPAPAIPKVRSAAVGKAFWAHGRSSDQTSPQDPMADIRLPSHSLSGCILDCTQGAAMNLPCAILLARLCLPVVDQVITVHSSPFGAGAITKMGEAEISIELWSDALEGPPRGRYCHQGACIGIDVSSRAEPRSVVFQASYAAGNTQRQILIRAPDETSLNAVLSSTLLVLDDDGPLVPLSEIPRTSEPSRPSSR